MTGDDLRLHTYVMQVSAQPKPQRLDAQKVDLLAEQPARVIFAKAVGGYQRQILVIGGVGNKVAARLDHDIQDLKGKGF